MTEERSRTLIGSIHRLVKRSGAQVTPDGDLLNRFIVERDEIAFNALVQKYGPLVMGVCKRVLGNIQDAEDAFQATFLVLLLKARPIADPSLLANWLYGVAYNTARNARTSALRRHARERALADTPRNHPETQDNDLWELKSILDEELQRLPDKYRAPIILCELRGLSRKEVARQLRCPEGTLSSRLASAHERLHARLASRGLVLSAGAIATAFSCDTAAASISASLVASTVKIGLLVDAAAGLSSVAVPAPVAALAHGAMKKLLVAKLRIAASILLAVCMVTGAGLLWGQAFAEKPIQIQPSALVSGEKPMTTPVRDAQETIVFTGQVLDPQGKPITGAKLFALKVPKDPPRNELDIEVPERGVTGADGRFRIELPRSDVRTDLPFRGKELPLLAVASGYGLGWVGMPTDKAAGELAIHLVKDEPIRGRVLTTEGKPIAGVEIQVLSIGDLGKDGVDGFLNAWKAGNGNWQGIINERAKMLPLLNRVLKAATSDSEGRFQISGVGAHWLAMLLLKGPSIGVNNLFVLTQAGLDAAPINTAAANVPATMRGPAHPPLLYGPTFNFIATSGRVIEGVVREAGTGKPIPGITVSTASELGGAIRATSDAQGRYRLGGLKKDKQYLLFTLLDDKSTWLRGGASVDDKEGLEPLNANIDLAHGVVVHGRVIDKQTGKGVQAGIRFVALPNNKYFGKPGYDSHRYEKLMESTDSEGRFRLVGLPGKILIMAQVQGKPDANGNVLKPYRQAVADADYKSLFRDEGGLTISTADNGVESLGIENACKVLDLKQGEPATTELFVDPGVTAKIEIQDSGGKPLAGSWVSGVTESWPVAFLFPTSRVTIYALNPDKARDLAIFNSDKKLGGIFPIRGNEQQPLIVKLGPLGKLTGRFLEEDGSPLEGATILLNPDSENVNELYRFAAPKTESVITDKEGRFTLETILPDMPFSVAIIKGKQRYQGKPKIGILRVKPGENLNLGDRKLELRPQ